MLHEVINPATEEIVTSVELFDAGQTDEAIARSRKAFETCYARSLTPSMLTASIWPSSRSSTPGTRSATRGGRQATRAT
jgi:hypothetical protein